MSEYKIEPLLQVYCWGCDKNLTGDDGKTRVALWYVFNELKHLPFCFSCAVKFLSSVTDTLLEGFKRCTENEIELAKKRSEEQEVA